ncbi:hypothetical protein T11_14302, partial [Trichinella zimbabwensis]
LNFCKGTIFDSSVKYSTKLRSLVQYFFVLGNPIFLHFQPILISLLKGVSKNSKTFRNSVLIFTYEFKNANGMLQRNSTNLLIVLLLTKYNIMQDIVPYVNSTISRGIRNLATCDQVHS